MNPVEMLDPVHAARSGASVNLAERAGALRTEMIDLAFRLECEGRMDAADIALFVAERLVELQGPPERPNIEVE